MQNILLSSIFRKLPLKLLLVILAIVSVFIACTKAENVIDLTTFIEDTTKTINAGQYSTIIELNNSSDYGTYCILLESMEGGTALRFGFGNSLSYGDSFGYVLWNDWTNVYACLYSNSRYIFFQNNTSYNTVVKYKLFKLNALLNTQIPVYSSLECQTEYNLIPISEVDSSYCQSNNLCPSGGTPSDCPNVGVSNLFINDIFHPGAFNIIMNIPEEIDWDYAYTNSGSNFNIDVVGYNQDTEYINGLIDINNYKPDSEDFTKVFMLFKEYSGLLLACLFVILVFYFVKKSFK